ncbi:MAG: hypothetical protein AB8I08_37375 [Sandaracinaceae bacterium]
MTRHASLGALLTVGALLISLPAHAQWTLPEGQLVVTSNVDVQYADSEFFGQEGEPRSLRSFPLAGEYYAATTTIDMRLGVTNNLEFELAIPLAIVAYTSDPVVLLPQPMGSMESSLDYYQRNVIDLTQARAGLSDVRATGRYRFLSDPFQLTGELQLKIPGGYDAPEGTFGARPDSIQDFVENVGTFVAPENVRDDVVLGDGQVDLIGRILFGASFPTGTFFAGDAGYNVRFDDAGHQVLASLRVGQMIEGIVLLFAGASFGISVTEGRTIGVSVAADDPNLPAQDYGGTDNLLLREVRLQRDYLDVYGGVIFRLSPEVELKLAYGRTVWGRNTAAVNTFTIGVGARTRLFGQDPAPPPPPVEDVPPVVAEPAADEAWEEEAPAPAPLEEPPSGQDDGASTEASP